MAAKNMVNNESKNAAQQQVNNEVESVCVGEMTLDAIQPAMVPISEPEPAEEKAVTMPLGQHGTLVIGGVPKREKKPTNSEPTEPDYNEQAEPTVIEPAKPTNSGAKRSYTVVLLPAKSGGVWPKMYGFRSEKEAKAMADKMPSSVSARWDYGQNGEGRETKTRHWYLTGGKRYCGVMQELADALNQGDRVAVANVAAKACGVYAAVVADGKQNEKKGEAKPKREKGSTKFDLEKPKRRHFDLEKDKPEAAPATTTTAPAAPAMSSEEQAAFELFKRFMAGDKEAVAQVNTLLKAA